MEVSKNITTGILLLVLSLIIFSSMVSALNFSQSWNCASGLPNCEANYKVCTDKDGNDCLTCTNVRPVWDSSSNLDKRAVNLTFSAPVSGNYNCKITITETAYGYYDGDLSAPQKEENLGVKLNSLDLGRTIDYRCNSGSSCASCRLGITAF